jgi:ribokinase
MQPDVAEAAISRAQSVDLVIGQLEVPQNVTTAAFRAARSRQAITILNPAPAAPVQRELLETSDWIVPNELEFAELSWMLGIGSVVPDDEECLRAVRDATGCGIVVTLGPRGARAVTSGGQFISVSPPPTVAVDTTGAGDAFIGAFAYALASRCGPEEAIRLGCACATDSVGRAGTQKSFPTKAAAQVLRSQVRRGIEQIVFDP